MDLFIAFETESLEGLVRAERALPGAPAAAAMEELFHPFHSGRSVAGFLQLHQIASLASAVERVVGPVRRGEVAWGAGHGGLIAESIAAMRRLIEIAGGNARSGKPVGAAGGIDALLARLHEAAAIAGPSESRRPTHAA